MQKIKSHKLENAYSIRTGVQYTVGIPFGGAEPLSILLGHSYIGNPSDNYEDLLIGETYTNLRKLPLCQCEVRNPLSMMLIIGKDSLQGPRNGR